MDVDNFRTVIYEAVQDSTLNLRERVKLRLIMRFRREELEEELFAQAQAEGIVPVSATIDGGLEGIDWEGLAKFIKEVLPSILQIISLFI